MKNLFLGICLAPYRIDFYNYLYKNFDCNIYFLNDRMMSQNYNMDLLSKQSCYTPQYLKSKKIGKRKIVIGLKKLIEQNNPEVVFVPEFSILTIQIILIKFFFHKKFRIISICDDSYDMVCGNDFSKMHRIARKIIPSFLDNLFLVDKKVVAWYQEKTNKGIWFPIISDENRIRNKYRELLPLSNKLNKTYHLEFRKVILFVGRLVEIKNVNVLIKACSRLKDKAQLVIIGDGPEMEKLKEMNCKLNAGALFLGRLEGDELMAWYNIADIFVLPSLKEAFGAVTNESLLAGCHTIVSEKAGSSSIIIPNINGQIFSPNSSNELTSLLDKQIEKIEKESRIVLKDNLMQIEFNKYLEEVLKKV